jgi:hypothetical protein
MYIFFAKFVPDHIFLQNRDKLNIYIYIIHFLGRGTKLGPLLQIGPRSAKRSPPTGRIQPFVRDPSDETTPWVDGKRRPPRFLPPSRRTCPPHRRPPETGYRRAGTRE